LAPLIPLSTRSHPARPGILHNGPGALGHEHEKVAVTRFDVSHLRIERVA